MADLAQGRMRTKIDQLTEALTGRFNDHHRFMVTFRLQRIDQTNADIAQLDRRIDELIADHGYTATLDLLQSIPGMGKDGSEELLAELGADMTVFPSPRTPPHNRSASTPWQGVAMGWTEEAAERTNLMALIVERFALLEYTLRQTLARLMSADPVVAHVYTAQAGVTEMITKSEQILKESARKKVERGSPELREALQAAKAAFDHRNDLLHNLTLGWTEEDGKDVAWIQKPRRGQDEPMLIPAQLDNLRAIYYQANHAINALRGHQPQPPFDMPKPY